MTSTQPSDRYTADIALKHPWISRNELDLIPFSFAEEQAAFNRAQYLVLVRIISRHNLFYLLVQLFLKFRYLNVLSFANICN